MARPKRILYPGAIYHLMSRGNHGERIFRDDFDRLCFLDILGAAHTAHHVKWRSYTLMGTHYHLEAETPFANLPDVMKTVNGDYTQAWNRRHKKFGHLFAERYRSKVIEDDRYALTVLKYIAWNPVEAEYVRSPQDWIWSSCRATAGLSAPPDFLDLEWLQRFFGGRTLAEAQREFRTFIEIPIESLYDEGLQEVVVGSDQFQGAVRQHICSSMFKLMVPRTYRALARPTLGTLFAGLDGNLERRDLLIRRAQIVYGYRQSEIARTLNLHPNTVSKIVRRMKRQRYFLVRTS